MHEKGKNISAYNIWFWSITWMPWYNIFCPWFIPLIIRKLERPIPYIKGCFVIFIIVKNIMCNNDMVSTDKQTCTCSILVQQRKKHFIKDGCCLSLPCQKPCDFNTREIKAKSWHSSGQSRMFKLMF